LDPFETLSLDECLGLARDWRAAARRRRRDEALVAIAGYFPLASRARRAAEVHRLLRRYAGTRWARTDRFRATTPAAYTGRVDAHLFTALRAGGGAVVSPSRLRQILASRCRSMGSADNPGAVAISTPGADNARHATNG
jgi:hypothetical protein